jgi:rhamnosyltransferase
VDFWGLSESRRISPHLQSFFVAFRPWLVSSRAFDSFWSNLQPISERMKVIRRYEVGLTSFFAEAGFAWGAYYAESESERRLARHRVAWWMAHRGPLPPVTQLRSWYAEQCRAGWNPAVGLADVALDGGRLPYVKLDTLRYDPYGLGSGKLLALCEQRFPESFEGVRDHIDATREFYPPRTRETLRPTPPLLRPMRRLVEYGRAA